ncbi:MAG: M56 family metallopeptidase [Candidatus Brocadiia bacterium]
MEAIDIINRVGRWLVPYLGRLSLELAILAGVVLLAILVLRLRSARLRHAFWGLVLAKPVVTLLIASPFSLYWFLRPPEPAPRPPTPVRTVVAPVPRVEGPANFRMPSRPRMVRPPLAMAPEPVWWRQVDAYGVAAALWAAGGVLFALRLVFGFAFVSFLRRTGVPQRTGPLAAAARDAAGALGMRRPIMVALSPVAHGPVLAGVLRPEVLLPEPMADDLSEQQLRLIVAHESAHARRKDNAVLLVQRLAEMFLFFHPAVWLCGWAMRRDAETACDDAVLSAYGAARTDYAQSLIEVADITRRSRQGLTRRLLLNTFAAAETRFTQRVRRILDGRKGRMTVGLTAAAVLALITIAVVGLPTSAARKPKDATEKTQGAKMSEDAPGTVKREDGKFRVEGVPTMEWGRSCDTTFAGAMEAALAVTDHPYTATQIMGYSGLAFRVRWAGEPDQGEKTWCGSIPVGEFFETQAAVAEATGWRFRVIDEMANEQDPRMGRYADDIAAAIGSGLPVVGYPTKDDLNVAVAYGCEGEGADRKFLWRTYWSGSEPKVVPAEDVGPWVMIPAEFSGQPDARQRLLDSLSISVRNWHRVRSLHPNGYPYAWGEAALQAWREDIRTADELSEERRKELFFANWWNYEIWQDARARAAAFLKDEAPLLAPEARDAVLRAAELYEQEAQLLQAQLGKAEAFLGPWSGKAVDDWTPQVRKREEDILSETRELEARAIAEIQAALAAEGVEPGPDPATFDGGGATPAKVRREGGKVWIEGMEDVDWGGSFFTREDSQARCLVEALRCFGRDADYVDVLGLSGAAFKLTMAPNLFVAEVHSEMGMEWPDIVSRVWGVDYDWQAIPFSDEENPDWREELREAAAESIGRGVPLFYMNGEWNLLVGYREDGGAFICKPYDGSEKGYKESETPTGFVGEAWFASVLRPAGQPADRRESVIRSLRTAVELANRGSEKDGERLFGFEAYGAWIAALEEDREDAWKHGNAFSYSQVLTSRQAAAAYLRRVADELGGDAAGHLRAAADRYAAIARRLEEGKDCVMWPWEEKWTVKNRAKEADLLRRSQADERAAVAEIAAALKAEGVQVQPGAAAAGPTREDGKVWLDGLEWYPSWMTLPGCLVACSRYLGLGNSPDWIYGGSGFAFALNVHRVLCPSGPTAWGDEACNRLAGNVGLRVEGLFAGKQAGDFAEKQAQYFRRVQEAIDAGLPVLGW